MAIAMVAGKTSSVAKVRVKVTTVRVSVSLVMFEQPKLLTKLTKKVISGLAMQLVRMKLPKTLVVF